MNTAFIDAQNLAWKIHHVESGFAKRSILKTYESERRAVAENLLNFDNAYAKLFSTRQPSAGEIRGANEDQSASSTETNKFVELFKASCDFTSGYGASYGSNELNWTPEHSAQGPLFHPKGTKLRTGRVILPANVVRVVDANEVHLEEEIPVNGAYRIYLFAGTPSKTKTAVADFAANLNKRHSFYKNYEREDVEKVSYHEQHNPHSSFFTICTIYAAPRGEIEIAALPPVLARYSNHVYADVVPDWRVEGAAAPAHAKMGIDPERGAVVVARPDAYVACVVDLVEGTGTVDALNQFFSTFTTREAKSVESEARL